VCISHGTSSNIATYELGELMTALTLSEDTKAILLLCGNFGNGQPDDDRPLSLAEYNHLANWLTQHQYRPADLVTGKALEMLKEESPQNIIPARCERLLARGAAMAFALERWMNKGVWVVCRSESEYPRHVREHLRTQAPAILFGIGSQRLLDAGGLAIVGSRNVDQEGSDFASEVARQAARDGICIISGGAKGVDQIAMGAALEAGGTAIGVLADSLLKISLRHDVRDFIRSQQLMLISPYHPESAWSIGSAMGRNKHIYALSDYALVVSADYEKGGTWSGAIEELRRDNHVPMFVRQHGTVPKGNQELLKRGGVPFPQGPWNKSLPELIDEASQPLAAPAKALQKDLFARPLREAEAAGPELLSVAKETQVAYASGSAATKAPQTVFEAVWPMLYNVLQKPRTTAELSAELDVQKTQIERWLKEGTKRGLVKKRAKPVRYVAVALKEPQALFQREDVQS